MISLGSLGSLVALVNRLPISYKVSMTSSFHVRDVSIAIGAHVCVEVMAVYFVRLVLRLGLQRLKREENFFERGFRANVSVSGAVASTAIRLRNTLTHRMR